MAPKRFCIRKRISQAATVFMDWFPKSFAVADEEWTPLRRSGQLLGMLDVEGSDERNVLAAMASIIAVINDFNRMNVIVQQRAGDF
jgi:hypothetical protein